MTAPLQNFPNYICVEGNIGAGKTTFVKRFAEITNGYPIFEQFSENPFLPLFYKNGKEYAFPLEMSFLAERYNQLSQLLPAPEIFATHYIADYWFTKTLLFAKQNLMPNELKLFTDFYKILNQKLPQPKAIIYLHTNLDYLQQNIKKRGRIAEQNISTKYLENIQQIYTDSLKKQVNIPKIYIQYSEKQWPRLDELIQKSISYLTNPEFYSSYKTIIF